MNSTPTPAVFKAIDPFENVALLDSLALGQPIGRAALDGMRAFFGMGPSARDAEWWALQTRKGGFNPTIPTPVEVLELAAPQDPDGIAWCDEQPGPADVAESELVRMRGFAGMDDVAIEREVVDRLSDGYPLW